MINNGQQPPATVKEVHAGHQENSFTRKVEQHWDRLHGEPVEVPSLVVSQTRLHAGNSPLHVGYFTRGLSAVPSSHFYSSKHLIFKTTFLYSFITTVELEVLGWQLKDLPSQTYETAILATADVLFVGDEFSLV